MAESCVSTCSPQLFIVTETPEIPDMQPRNAVSSLSFQHLCRQWDWCHPRPAYGCRTEPKLRGFPISPNFTERARLVLGTICNSLSELLDRFDNVEVLSIKLAIVHNVEQTLFSLLQRTKYDGSYFFGFS